MSSVTMTLVKRLARGFGFALLAGGTLVSVAYVTLALLDSPRAPRWIDVFVPTYIAVIGAFIVLVTTVTGRPPIVWAPAHDVPESLLITPRHVTSSGFSRRLILAAGAVFAGIVLNTPSGFYPHLHDWAALRHRGVETTGMATRRVKQGSPAVYYLHYRYLAEGRVVDNSDDVPLARFRETAEGQQVPVTYLPRRPEIAMAMRRADLTWGYLAREYWYLLVFMLAPAIFLPVLFALLRRVEARMIGIARDGDAVLARVTDANRSMIRYEFEGGSGAVYVARRKVIGTPRAGDGLVVFYDREQPNAPLALIALDEITIGDGQQSA